MTVKKITLKGIKENEVLSKQEMKELRGGSCGYQTDWQGGSPYICTTSAEDAEKGAGGNGWWCCGCAEIAGLC